MNNFQPQKQGKNIMKKMALQFTGIFHATGEQKLGFTTKSQKHMDRIFTAIKPVTLVLGALLLVCAGCITTPFDTFPILPRDGEEYTGLGPDGDVLKEGSVAIHVSEFKPSPDAVVSLESALTSWISGFPIFTVSERRVGALELEHIIDGRPFSIQGADYLLTAIVNNFNVEMKTTTYMEPISQTTQTHASRPQQGKGGSRNNPPPRSTTTTTSVPRTRTDYVASINVNFRLIEIASGKIILSESITQSRSCENRSDANSQAASLAQRCVGAYASELGKRFTRANVLLTHNNGEFALISMGKNSGVFLGTRIEFMEFVDRTRYGGGSREPQIIAFGRVGWLQGDDRAWVKVDNFEKMNVKLGHYARIGALLVRMYPY